MARDVGTAFNTPAESIDWTPKLVSSSWSPSAVPQNMYVMQKGTMLRLHDVAFVTFIIQINSLNDSGLKGLKITGLPVTNGAVDVWQPIYVWPYINTNQTGDGQPAVRGIISHVAPRSQAIELRTDSSDEQPAQNTWLNGDNLIADTEISYNTISGQFIMRL